MKQEQRGGREGDDLDGITERPAHERFGAKRLTVVPRRAVQGRQPVGRGFVEQEVLALRSAAPCCAYRKRPGDSAHAELALLQKQIDNAVVLSVEDGLHEDDTATSEDGYLVATIIARELDALLNFHAGKTDQALHILAGAVADENTRPLTYGPPHVPKPASELFGEMLLVLGQPYEAAGQFQTSLERNTGKSQSLLGLARAQEATDDAAAAQTRQQVEASWRGDIARLRELDYSWLMRVTAITSNSGR